jgi:hypothetical protein
MSMGKDECRSLLERAEMTGRTFPMKNSWRKAQVFAGVLTCFLILTIPLGVWMIMRARKARVGISEEGFVFTYLTTFGYHWNEIEEFHVSGMSGMTFGGGLIGVAAAAAVQKKTVGLKGPLQFKVKGKRGLKMIPAHTIENSLEMARQMEQLSGIQFLPQDSSQ